MREESDLATARVGTVDKAGTEMELDRQTYSRAETPKENTQIAPATPQMPLSLKSLRAPLLQ